MANDRIIFTDKMYVGFQKRSEGDRGDILLGFATYIKDDKAFEKRKGTIDSWAEGYSWQKKESVPAKIMDNDLLEGFKIADDVKRCGWNGGNVVWRIEDPRGFELEISSANLASIMDCVDIKKGGIIDGKCKWAWSMRGGSKVVLLPENSEPYLQAIEDTRRDNISISWKDVNIGDLVELKNGYKGTYCGYLHYLDTCYVHHAEHGEGAYVHGSSGRTWRTSKKKVHFFNSGGRVYFMASPKAASIVEKSPRVITEQQGADIINNVLRKGAKSGRAGTSDWRSNSDECVVFVQPTPIKLDDWSISLNEITPQDAINIIDNRPDYDDEVISTMRDLYFETDRLYNMEGQMYNYDHIKKHEQEKGYQTIAVSKDALIQDRKQLTVSQKRERQSSNMWYCRGPVYDTIVQNFFKKEIESAKCYKLVVKYNNVEYPSRLQ